MEAQNSTFLTDTHAHLSSAKFEDDLEAIVAQASDAGVKRIITIACDLEDSESNLRLAERFEGVFPTAGIHPLYVHELPSPDWLDSLREYAANPRIVALGEIGLDYFHAPQDGSSDEEWRNQQRIVFEQQLDLARDLDLPVVIHQRESAEDVTSVLKQFPEVKAVLHCFNGTREQAETALEMGHYLSFTGILTFPRAEDVREVARDLPLDRIMVETDCPYLAPVPFRGKRCEPSMVKHTANMLAEVRGLSFEEIASTTSTNATRFFRGLENP